MPRLMHAVIIFNPNSTGDSPALAQQFADDLQQWDAHLHIVLKKTERHGHGGKITEEAAKRLGDKLLVVSVSGHGGHHEVINGVMRAVNNGNKAPYCAVLPGGNA